MRLRCTNLIASGGVWKFSIGKIYDVRRNEYGDQYLIDDRGLELWLSVNTEGGIMRGAGVPDYEFKEVK